jgi:hypothetical protein
MGFYLINVRSTHFDFVAGSWRWPLRFLACASGFLRFLTLGAGFCPLALAAARAQFLRVFGFRPWSPMVVFLTLGGWKPRGCKVRPTSKVFSWFLRIRARVRLRVRVCFGYFLFFYFYYFTLDVGRKERIQGL